MIIISTPSGILKFFTEDKFQKAVSIILSVSGKTIPSTAVTPAKLPITPLIDLIPSAKMIFVAAGQISSMLLSQMTDSTGRTVVSPSSVAYAGMLITGYVSISPRSSALLKPCMTSPPVEEFKS